MVNGIVQGSVISPILFSIMIIDLPEHISSKNALLADDFDFWESGFNVDLENLQSRSNACMRVSTSKTVVVLFTNRRKRENVELIFNSQKIPVEDKMQYLGIIFVSRVTYRYHIDNLHKTCVKRLNFLRMISGTHWGSRLGSVMLILYRTLTRS